MRRPVRREGMVIVQVAAHEMNALSPCRSTAARIPTGRSAGSSSAAPPDRDQWPSRRGWGSRGRRARMMPSVLNIACVRRKRVRVFERLPFSTVVLLLLCGVWANMVTSPAAAADPMGLLLGPVAPLGTPASISDVAAYDSLEVSQGRLYADGFPEYPTYLAESNFYDLALALYHVYARSGDVYWRDRARMVAVAWRDDLYNQNIARRLEDWRSTDYVP